MRWLATILSLLFLGFCSTSCTVRQAQTNAQTALTAAAEGVDAADAVVDEALPGAIEQAGDQAIANGCADLRACMDAAEDILEPWTNAVTGLRHARDTLQLLQDSLSLWINTGALPDWGPTCESAEDVFTSLLGLLTTVGLEPPAALSTVAPHVSTACGLVVGLVRSQRDR
jgi:hypothetical protein